MTTQVAPGYGGGYAAPNSEQNQSWVPLAAALGAIAVAVLGAAAIISAVDGSSSSKPGGGGRCFQRAVERLFEDRLTYTEEDLRKTVLELTIRKFQEEGSGKRKMQRGLSRSEVEPAARESMLKSLKGGFTPRKMERFLNDHVWRLRKVSSPAVQRSLRYFDPYQTACWDLSKIAPSDLFRYNQTERFIVLSFQKLDRMRKGDPAHFDPILHNGKEWVIANRPAEPLVEGSATCEDAKRALDEFARRKYGGLKRHGVHTVFSERA